MPAQRVAQASFLSNAHDPHRLGHKGSADGNAALTSPSAFGPASKHIVATFGFWLFLLSDIIMFSALFATYAVLAHATAGGPSALQLLDIRNVAIETIVLVLSSFTCGIALLAAKHKSSTVAQAFLVATGILGSLFLVLEIREFAHLISVGAGPDRSAFLSAFFALVGCHGLHVLAGLIWLATMLMQIRARGFRPEISRRLMCFSLFWHALDIIWVAVFTLVYLYGVLP
ncbi:cytochrome o ubiquinol oxidase subunit III [Rhizobium sp. S152]|uniref:cytochrome o ubiquinol oxidase subunit III n=1 Tax=Rhizobium sp. S152 TaxID=3055038 RepID=UPI0025AA0122|nr:cytochrome o ubiquinol oxidase subunit III [Rhizobium sp. S152]MDM9627808.1 cytochrome o ubiquinol oxidase subunit III [Rhizobium sp. S152]